MKEKKKRIIITTAGLLILLITIIGATYAYFTAQMGEGVGTDINASTGTTYSLSFQAGKAINIVANQENFGKDKGNQSDSTTATATLVANNVDNHALYNFICI